MDINNNPDHPVIRRTVISAPIENWHHASVYIRWKGCSGRITRVCPQTFPGHGDTDVDSHYGLPLVSMAKNDFVRSSFILFKKQLMLVLIWWWLAMFSSRLWWHTTYKSKLDGSDSWFQLHFQKVMTGLLRQEMGFNGVIVTDALNMKAIWIISDGKRLWSWP